jgi:vancomycin resistance protein YoaR
VAGTAALVLVLATAAWALDTRGHEVVRNVTLEGRSVAGWNEARLRPLVAGIAHRYDGMRVDVRQPADDGAFAATTTELAVEVDQDATVEAALDMGRTGALPVRPFGWVASFLDEREVPVRLHVDRAKVAAEVAARDPKRTPPTEPSLEVDDGSLKAVEGKNGRGVDPADLVDALRESAQAGTGQAEFFIRPGPLPPRFDKGDAVVVANRGEDLLSSGPLKVSVGDREAEVPVPMLRSWMRAVPGEHRLELQLDPAAVQKDLAELVPEAGEPPVDASFRVQGGGVAVIAGRNGTGCCTEGAPGLLLAALENGRDAAVPLELRTLEPELTTDEASALGVREKIGEFTTAHPAGQPRVQNIHRIADIVRGKVIMPGGEFSVNGFVGSRTRSKGFVNAPVIYNGEFSDDVGGGISQFATTLFNAAFFAGLDFGEYQSHSIYISRYPYGREATLSYPHPDLVLRNPSKYGVVIWSRYTDSTITMELWSTRFANAEQTGQSESSNGRCKRVSTQRTRTFTDGRKATDSVSAIYRPGEGVDC